MLEHEDIRSVKFSIICIERRVPGPDSDAKQTDLIFVRVGEAFVVVAVDWASMASCSKRPLV